MDVFTDVYNKAKDLLKTKSLDADWSAIEAKLKSLLGDDGPDDGKAGVLKEIRDKLAAAGKGQAKPAEEIAKEILRASKTADAGFQDRAALLKAMKHFYFVRRKGNQKIWVVDCPKNYDQWTFDLFAGKSKSELRAKLQREQEAFGAGNRKLMSDALQLARKWSTDIVAKLGTPDDATLKVVKRWFHFGPTTDKTAKKTVAILLDGFKKISTLCNSTQVIFSDRPHKRAGNTNVFASVNAADKMPVIYIFKLFLDNKGQIGKLWLCALTIIHEISHKLIDTDDIRYDDDGLKPRRSFTNKKAINNADTWGYFAADIVGALPQEKFEEVYQ
jgi:hypothetical protein